MKKKDFKVTKFDKSIWGMVAAHGKMFQARKKDRYCVVSERGWLYTSVNKPVIVNDEWVTGGDGLNIAGFVKFEGDWRKSLVKLEKINLNVVFRNNGINLKFWD